MRRHRWYRLASCFLALAVLCCYLQLRLLASVVGKDASDVVRQTMGAFAGDKAFRTSVHRKMPDVSDVPTGRSQDTQKKRNDRTAHARTSTSRQPQLIIHIGPSKTGTTTIQKESIALQDMGVLRKDNFLYWGRYQKLSFFEGRSLEHLSTLFHASSFRDYQKLKRRLHFVSGSNSRVNGTNADAQVGSGTEFDRVMAAVRLRQTQQQVSPNLRRMQQLHELLRFLHDQGQSVLISDEALSYVQMFSPVKGTFTQRHYFEDLSEVLSGWNVTVVAGYRRLAEWMLSAVKEYHAKIVVYGDIQYGNNTKKPSMLWPHQGGNGLMPSWNLIDQWLFDPQWKRVQGPGTTTSFYKYIDFSLPVWGRHGGFHTAILNLHANDQSSIMARLYCDVIGREYVPVTCSYLKRTLRNDIVYNAKAVPWFAYNQLLFDASKRGMSPERGVLAERSAEALTRIEATNAFKQYYEHTLNKSFIDLPLLCPRDEDLERLYQASVEMERRVLSTNMTGDDHRRSFEVLAYEKRYFCWVRTKIVLRQLDSWDSVLERLRYSNATTWPVEYMKPKSKTP